MATAKKTTNKKKTAPQKKIQAQIVLKVDCPFYHEHGEIDAVCVPFELQGKRLCIGKSFALHIDDFNETVAALVAASERVTSAKIRGTVIADD